MTSRRKTRELALCCCYEIDVGKQVPDAVLSRVIHENKLDMASRDFLHNAITRTFEAVNEIDRMIMSLAKGWRLERIARIDLAILRLAIAELLIGFEDPPPTDAISINEAIVLAKKFSTQDSGKFINGILATVVDNKEFYRKKLNR